MFIKSTMKTLIASVIIYPIACWSAQAQDKCETILTSGLYNTTKVVNKGNAASARKYKMCDMNFHEYQAENSSAAANASNSAGSFNAVGYGGANAETGDSSSAAITSESFSRWKQKNCLLKDSSSNEASYQFFGQKALAKSVVKSWRECMLEREGLSCFIKPSGSQTAGFLVVNWRRHSTTLPQITRWTAKNGTVTVKNGYQLGQKLQLGTDQLLIEAKEPNSFVFINLTVSHTGGSFNCHAVLPSVAHISRTEYNSLPPWKKEVIKLYKELHHKASLAKTKSSDDEFCSSSQFILIHKIFSRFSDKDFMENAVKAITNLEVPENANNNNALNLPRSMGGPSQNFLTQVRTQRAQFFRLIDRAKAKGCIELQS